MKIRLLLTANTHQSRTLWKKQLTWKNRLIYNHKITRNISYKQEITN